MQSSNYLGLITFNANGIVVANYQQVRAVITQQFKSIYGSDIDLSSNTADGIYIETLSLLINNMLQTIKTMYSNLDVRTANGKYLDTLCALTNITRRQATKSSVYVTITGLDSNFTFGPGNQLVLLDKNGTTWTCDVFTTNLNGEATVLTFCDEYGPVSAPVGWIYTTVEVLGNVTITMNGDAILGSFIESDSELRSRRDNVLSMKSSTVLEGLVASLLNISGIEDCKIYNNDTAASITAKDGTIINKSNIYIILRKTQNIPIEDSMIGSIIYSKKTPGVHTTETTDLTGTLKSYNYPNSLGVTQTIHWKECVRINPTIVVKVQPSEYFVSGDNASSTSIKIANDVIKFANGLRISENINMFELQSVIHFADPKYRGLSTYTLNSVTIDALNTNYINKDTSFNYTNIVITGSAPGEITITIS